MIIDGPIIVYDRDKKKTPTSAEMAKLSSDWEEKRKHRKGGQKISLNDFIKDGK